MADATPIHASPSPDDGGAQAHEAERSARLRLLLLEDGVPARLREAIQAHGTAVDALLARGDRDGDRVLDETSLGERERAIIPGDADWPSRLDELETPPSLLFVRGGWPPTRRLLGVVGARRADAYGLAMTSALAEAAAEAGWTVLSGGARGIDGAAHEGALAARGRTLVVLGGGFARPYPAEHRELFERVVASGALISEYPPRRRPRPGQFPERNRIIAALADALVVIQATRRSGALSTARVARSQGRPIVAVPGDVCYGLSAGTAGLLATGATAVAGPKHLRSILRVLERGEPPSAAGWPLDPEGSAERSEILPGGWTPSPRRRAGRRTESAVPWLAAALHGRTPQHVDDVVAESGKTTAEVLGAIVTLELEGELMRLPGGRVALRDG